MAKKPKNAKKSRFGNPAKAAADTAARAHAISLDDVRLDRAMEALAPGFALWLEDRGKAEANADVSLMILDDFFDMYRILEPGTDARSLVPDAVREVLDAATAANPQATFALRSGIRDYTDYLVATSLWTGGLAELEELDKIFVQPAWPGWAPGTELNLAALLTGGKSDGGDLTTGFGDADGAGYDDLDYEEVSLEDYEFAEIHLLQLSQEEVRETVKSSPLWLNTLALLDWIGDGRELTENGILIDQDGAAATLSHTGLGRLAAAANFTTPQDHAAARLALYWDMLAVAGLITVDDTHVLPTPDAVSVSDQAEMLAIMTDLIGTLIYNITLEGSEEGDFEEGQVELADWLTQAASATPPTSALLIQALEEPNTVHPDLLFIAQNIAHWAEEGLVTIGEFVEVPPAWRPDVFDMLKDDFPLHVGGPGAGAIQE